jgi:hypothetical protein
VKVENEWVLKPTSINFGKSITQYVPIIKDLVSVGIGPLPENNVLTLGSKHERKSWSLNKQLGK